MRGKSAIIQGVGFKVHEGKSRSILQLHVFDPVNWGRGDRGDPVDQDGRVPLHEQGEPRHSMAAALAVVTSRLPRLFLLRICALFGQQMYPFYPFMGGDPKYYNHTSQLLCSIEKAV